MKTLRPHQHNAITYLRKSLMDGYRRPLLQAPTGAGKTVIAAAIIRMALAKGKRVIFTVPAIELIDQTAQSFWNEGIRDIGVIQANHVMTDPERPVQVASIQTLQRRRIPPADLVVIDEAHRMFKFVTEWMAHEDWLDVPFIGLSATPWTKGLGRLYDRLIIAATTKQLIAEEHLAPFRVYAPSHPDLTGVRTKAGDYHEADLAQAMAKGTLTADIVTTWLAKGENRPTLCFAVDRAHAQALQAQFKAVGVPCGYVDAHTPKEEREAVRKQFASGALKVVCNVGVLTTGVDWDVRCIILARPTKSEMLYVQIIGRGLRTALGKQDCLILDHSDTTLRLGFVTDIHHDRLDDGSMSDPAKRKPTDEPLPKECPKCSMLRPPRVSTCPACGFKPTRQSDVDVQAGELIELDARRKAKNNREATWPEKVAFIAELRCYAQATGKKEGWVAHSYKDRFGVYPNDPRVKYAQPAKAVGAEVRNWITAKNIRFAKAHAR
jgi:superfamily II DNA or RNA helicase